MVVIRGQLFHLMWKQASCLRIAPQSSPKRSSVCSSLIFVLWIAWFAGLVVAELK